MRIIEPDGLIDSQKMHYSQAIVDGEDVYMSGQVGWDEEYEVAGEDIAAQARQVYENVETLLAEDDKDLEDVRKVTSYLVSPSENLEVWEDVFDAEPFPCHTILGVDSLALEEFLLEVEVEL